MLPRTIDRPEPVTLRFSGLVLQPGLNVVTTLAEIPVASPGALIQCSCVTSAVDGTVRDDTSCTYQDGMFRVNTSNLLVPVTQNRLDKQVSGGAGTFAADVDFTVGANVPVNGIAPLQLLAQNNNVAALTGDVTVHYWLNRGAW